MSNNKLDKLLFDAYYEEMKQELDKLPSDEELRSKFPITDEKRDSFVKRVYGKKKASFTFYLRRVAVFFLIFSAVTFGAMMINPEIRAYVIEQGVMFFDKYLQFDFSQDNSEYTINFDDIEIGYIPKGYELIYNDISDSSMSYIYHNNEFDSSISIDIMTDLTDINLKITNRFKNFETITIDGFTAYTSYDKPTNSSLIVWGNSNFQIIIVGQIGIDELKEVVRNIKY